MTRLSSEFHRVLRRIREGEPHLAHHCDEIAQHIAREARGDWHWRGPVVKGDLCPACIPGPAGSAVYKRADLSALPLCLQPKFTAVVCSKCRQDQGGGHHADPR